ncbi:MAG: hypothetical protein COZ06_24435 [Armatimonadetes bacterium CG_4_10_14_3_um_filter_66_18]|nr:hypothetical protein [Armatimonadota bacterium]OIO95744.1 MAG: hypothetical protein AUJ96_25985 [Armatimonadetes bacterium CG2_30_66_41]PIU95201.1 MAG: hypothetical protein COS65_03680 [Armatimonadetes bacterium CG06_land_8_20_14_3_00_66_21]PIX49311.1 MAG: hypothetical protein COZ57_03715 [Armatimonadetes bacterium CG_4_8_14_3_um_filter_66_20]PIY42790.1 MAG: hypothetical protein COZ06_24435 [Armatimonadetes bacterium CG_4_10_14_3_um_filter_66_18]
MPKMLPNPCRWFLPLALAFCTSGVASAETTAPNPKITTTLTGVPFEVVEGGEVAFTVNHDVARALGDVQLHVEMKGRGPDVLESQVVKVAGKGAQAFTFPVPPRNGTDLLTFAVWYGEVWTEAIVPIMTTDSIAVLSKEDAEKRSQQQATGERWREESKGVIPAEGAVAMLVDALPGFDRDLADRVAARLEKAELKVLALDSEQVCNPFILSVDNFHTFVLTSSQVYPADGGPALDRFLAQGGDLIALNAPGMQTPVKKIDGKWMGAKEIREALAAQKPSQPLFDFETGSPKDWTMGAPKGEEATWEFAAPGAEGTGHAFHCVVPDFRNWNTFSGPALGQPLAQEDELTCLAAKGGPDTSRLALEWVQKDGSRWIATIPLTTEWQRYALTPYEFGYWHDNPSRGRGGPDDHFRPENAAKLTVGLAQTHTPLPGGRHEFWIDEVGVAPNPFGKLVTPGQIELTPVEMLTPGYKFHRVTNAASLRVSDKQCLLPPGELPVPEGLLSAQPRPQGTGYNKERKRRWIPLLEAFDKDGEVCGTPACLVVNRVGRFAKSAVASFALPNAAYRDPRVLDLIAALAKRVHEGFFLFEGGAENYAYFQGETVTLGAQTINLGKGAVPKCSVRLTVTADGAKQFEQVIPLVDGRAECQWKPGRFSHQSYEVLCDLLDSSGRRLDALTHSLLVWEPSPKPDYMTSKDGDFYLHGNKWYAHGVNYMPSSGIGIEDGPYFEYWVDKQPYDPVVTERDLKHVKAMGLNMVSLFCYYRSLQSRNLLDILERCRRHGLMVNLSLRPGTPLDFQWDEMKALIEAYRLAENDTVFAYDLAWEPAFGNHNMRQRWDGAWEKWITQRYGSLANAEADWGVPVPRTEGKVTGPSDEQCSKEGPHRVMVCAYRRFLDDLLAKAHATANGLVKSIDPHHFTSFRMSIGGDPTISPAWIGYDFRGLARSVDIMEPEGYGRSGDWERVKPGRFTADYARCMAPGRPVMWAEFGRSTWNREAMEQDLELENWTGGFYNDFLRMAYESGASGTVCWWYPGGYRVGENSDYGILNPDGTWRPNTHALHDWAEKFTTPRNRKPVDNWLTIDRDATVGGLVGVYNQVKERYWQLLDQGKNPGLRTDGCGLDSATAPRTAVGNVPYKPGRNPHKYLDAEFDRLEIRNAKGEWQAVADGGTVAVKREQAIVARATVGNLGEAKWLAANGAGQVGLAAGTAFLPILQDVPFLGTSKVEGAIVAKPTGPLSLTFVMRAAPDVTFGEALRVQLTVE